MKQSHFNRWKRINPKELTYHFWWQLVAFSNTKKWLEKLFQLFFFISELFLLSFADKKKFLSGYLYRFWIKWVEYFCVKLYSMSDELKEGRYRLKPNYPDHFFWGKKLFQYFFLTWSEINATFCNRGGVKFYNSSWGLKLFCTIVRYPSRRDIFVAQLASTTKKIISFSNDHHGKYFRNETAFINRIKFNPLTQQSGYLECWDKLS